MKPFSLSKSSRSFVKGKWIGILAVLSTFACSNSTGENELSHSRIWVMGTVVHTATDLPAVNARVTVNVPIAQNDCFSYKFASVYTVPYDVRTDSLGRFDAEVTAFGMSPGLYCVEVAVGNTTIRQDVMFRLFTDRAVDTLTLWVQVQ